MGKLILSLLVVTLAGGCGPRVPPPPTDPSPDGTTPNRGDESGAVSEVKLAEAVTAKPLDKSEEPLFFVNVNSKGEVLLAPMDRQQDLAVLVRDDQIQNYMRLRAAEAKRTHPGKDGQPPRAVVILRVDKETPFAKTNSILKACYAAGFVKYQLRAIVSGFTAEGQMPLALPTQEASAVPVIPDPIDFERPEEYIATVHATDAGKIAKIVLRSQIWDEELGTKIETFSTKLKELRERGRLFKERQAMLTLEIDGKLLHEQVIQLIDTSNRVGFENMHLELLNLKKRERPPE